MLIVCAEEARVEASCWRAVGVSVVSGGAGAVGACPGAGAALSGGDRLLRPRRARCRGCAGTHVLLPELALSRRQDEVSVIGEAIVAKVAGEGFRRIAARLGVYPETVRGWLRRFANGRSGSGRISRGVRSRWIPSSGRCMPVGSGIADALEAIAVAGRAWVLRFGSAEPWQIASRLSGGMLLGNTNRPLEMVS